MKYGYSIVVQTDKTLSKNLHVMGKKVDGIHESMRQVNCYPYDDAKKQFVNWTKALKTIAIEE